MSNYKRFIHSWIANRNGIPPGEMSKDTNSFAEICIDSLGLIILISEIEDQYNICIDEGDLANKHITSITRLAILIEEKISKKDSLISHVKKMVN